MAFLLRLIQRKSGSPSGLLVSLVKGCKNRHRLKVNDNVINTQEKNLRADTIKLQQTACRKWIEERRKDPCWFKLA